MNPFGSGTVIIENGYTTDDGNFYTANKQNVFGRWVLITHEGGAIAYGEFPPRNLRKDLQAGKPIYTREKLKITDLSKLLPGPGKYFIRLWGIVGDDPDYLEIGSGNAADNGASDTVVGTWFTIGSMPPPPPPNNDVEELIGVLVATKEVNRNGYAFKHGGQAALSVDSYLDDAIARAKRL